MENENKTSAVFSPEEELTRQMKVHTNLKQELFFTTKDKLLLVLKDYKDATFYEQLRSTLCGVALTLFLTIVTSTPNDAFGISKDVWSAVFLLALAICLLGAGFSQYRLSQSGDIRDVDYVCEKIMRGSASCESSASSDETSEDEFVKK